MRSRKPKPLPAAERRQIEGANEALRLSPGMARHVDGLDHEEALRIIVYYAERGHASYEH